jgi:hypothetical protein
MHNNGVNAQQWAATRSLQLSAQVETSPAAGKARTGLLRDDYSD